MLCSRKYTSLPESSSPFSEPLQCSLLPKPRPASGKILLHWQRAPSPEKGHGQACLLSRPCSVHTRAGPEDNANVSRRFARAA